MSYARNHTPLLLILLLAGCASASDRFEDGLEAEAYGQWYRAANRYIEALEKDARMTEARDRLVEVGDSAITQSLRTVEDRMVAQDAVRAGEEYHRVDGLLARARTVGVRLPTPADYATTRRATFDAAIRELMASGDDALQRRQWAVGRRALARIRSDFEPDQNQRDLSFDSEALLLLDWAFAEEDAHRFRSAFSLAEEALGAAAQGSVGAGQAGTSDPSAGGPGGLVGAALALQDRAVAEGTLGLLLFPITKAPELEGLGETDPVELLSDLLELNHWRQPPLFIAVADPILVRTVTRRLTPPGLAVRPERVLEELGAQFGVLIEMTHLTMSEENVRRRTRNARTQRGTAATYYEEEGTLRYEVHAQVQVLDRDGRELEDFPVTQQETGTFERGVYEGNPGALDLSRSQTRLFDPVFQGQKRADIEETLMAQLAERIADQVFRKLLNRIP